MINANNNQETVGFVANKLRNFESMINVPMQPHVSAVIKSLQEEMREEVRRNSSYTATVQVTGPKARAQCPPTREKGYTPQADMCFFLCGYGEDMRR